MALKLAYCLSKIFVQNIAHHPPQKKTIKKTDKITKVEISMKKLFFCARWIRGDFYQLGAMQLIDYLSIV